MQQAGSKRTITIQDVAREAGVSAATVSRVMTGSSAVKPHKAQRVRAAIDKLGYKPNNFARSLLGLRNDTIGVLVPQLDDEFYGRLITGVERRLLADDYHVLCALGHANAREEKRALTRFLDKHVGGLILLADDLADEDLLELKDTETPFVLINRYVPELAPHCVRLDSVAGGYAATRHLLDAGHTRIAHLTTLPARLGVIERLRGYHQALQEAGIPADDTLVMSGSFDVEGGYQATRRLLELTDFSAIFAANDKMAVGALNALLDAGKRVPEDVALVGFDDLKLTTLVRPKLTTLHYPIDELGRLAAAHLLSQIKGETPAALDKLMPSLLVRDSSTLIQDTQKETPDET